MRTIKMSLRRGTWVTLHALVAVTMTLQTTLMTPLLQTSIAHAASTGVSLGSIRGTVYEDHNGNGVRDAEDQGIPNIYLQTTHGDGATTDANGEYIIYPSPNGFAATESVVEFTPSGWVTTGGIDNVISDISTPSGTDVVNIDFGNFHSYYTFIEGKKFNDLNGNGVWEESEPTISGVEIHLQKFDQYYFTHTDEYGVNDGFLDVDTTTTNVVGGYAFTHVLPGEYRVYETVPAGWSQTYPSSMFHGPFTVRSGITTGYLHFGNTQNAKPSSLVVHKQVDTNGNGAWDDQYDGQDAQGNGLGFRWGLSSGATKKLTSASADFLFGTSTDIEGPVTIIENTVSGYHYVGWYSGQEGSCATPNQGWPMLRSGGEENLEITLCNARDTGSIQGYKWNDVNGNGVWDENEPTISGVYIQTVNGQGATTNENGYYHIDHVPTGTTSVVEFTPKGWVNTNYSNAAINVVVNAGESTTLNFGNYELASISGVKFNDLNKNGTRDEGENGIPGWKIQLEKFDEYYFSHTEEYGVNDGYLVADEAPIETDANGNYSFTNLLPGKYRVSELQVAGWTQSAPASGVYTDITPLSGENIRGKDFGNWQEQVDTNATTTTTLSIQKTNNVPTFTNPGKNVTYTVTVTNTGSVAATNVSMNDVLPTGFTFTEGGQQSKTFSLGTIAPQQSAVQVYTVTIAPSVPTGNYLNVASAAARNANSVSTSSTVSVRSGSVLGDTTDRQLQLTKSADQTTSIADSSITYTVSVKNSGAEDLENVVVTDTLPSGATFEDGQGQHQWTIPLLAAGKQQDMMYAIHIPATQQRGSFTNHVSAVADFVDAVEASSTIAIQTPSVLGLATTGLQTNDRILFILSVITSILGFGLLQQRQPKSNS